VKRRKRILTRVEIYSKNYYKTKLKQLIDDVMEANKPAEDESPKERRVRRLETQHQVRAEAWAAESDEVKDAVEAEYQKQKPDPGNDEGDAEKEQEGDEQPVEAQDVILEPNEYQM
jgi:hypothetical protein